MENSKKKKKENEFDRDVAFGSGMGIGDIGGDSGDKSKFGEDVDESEGTQNPSRSGAHGYRDFIIDRLDKDFETDTFPESDHADVAKAAEDNAGMKEPSFAKLDDPSSGTKGSPEIEHRPESHKHSFSHDIDEDAIRKNKGMKLEQSVDDTAVGNDKEAETY
ncbi:MAG: hypothetical protein ABSD92_13095 [Candidatus Bathyarchaeia archaeon]|jgi:hypothetical protein